MITALEASLVIVPEELKQMWDDYVKEMAAQGKKAKACSGGFEGKGFKFNEQEESVSDERKKFQKVAFDLHVDSDEEDADIDLDEQIEDLFKSKRSVKDKTESGDGQQAQALLVPMVKLDGLISTAQANLATVNVANKLKMAKEIADKVSANRSASKFIS